jgi:hypothetical protein
LRRGQCFAVLFTREARPGESTFNTYINFGIVKVDWYFEKFAETEDHYGRNDQFACFQGFTFKTPHSYVAHEWRPFVKFNQIRQIQRYPRKKFDLIR